MNEACVDRQSVSRFAIVAEDSLVGRKLADALERAFGIRLEVAASGSGRNCIYLDSRPFVSYDGCRYGVTLENGNIYLDGGQQAVTLLVSLLAEGKLSQGAHYGYIWPEKAVNYGFILRKELITQLCEGVSLYHRSYARCDGEPVEAYIVVASADSPAKAAVWGCPQGESMVVPDQVSQMRSLGKDVIAAVNADFFHFFNNGDKTTFGAQIIDGVVYKEPNAVEHYGANWFGLTHDGEYIMSDLEGYFSTYRGRLSQAVGGGVWLMREQKPCFHSSPAVEPRTAVATTMDGGLVIACVDGRSSRSLGATYADLTQVFMDLPVQLHSVLNLDGGHSTILMGKQPDGSMAILNEPSSGLDALRPVADILTLVLPKPE